MPNSGPEWKALRYGSHYGKKRKQVILNILNSPCQTLLVNCSPMDKKARELKKEIRDSTPGSFQKLFD